jgi:hypothetical protein
LEKSKSLTKEEERKIVDGIWPVMRLLLIFKLLKFEACCRNEDEVVPLN